MTREEAIEYFKFHRKIFCEDYLKICPKDSIAYQATLKEKEFYEMAIKALEQEPINDTISKLLDETFDDFCNCPGGESYFHIDGEDYNTDAGYALEGMEIFIKVLKKRLADRSVEDGNDDN